jgi:hypothetical protein
VRFPPEPFSLVKHEFDFPLPLEYLDLHLGLGSGGSILVFAGLLDGLGKGSSLRGGNIFLVMSDGHSIGVVEGLSAGSTLVRIGANVGCL